MIMIPSGGGISTLGVWCLVALAWAMTGVGILFFYLGSPGAINMALGCGIFAIPLTVMATVFSIIEWRDRRRESRIL